MLVATVTTVVFLKLDAIVEVDDSYEDDDADGFLCPRLNLVFFFILLFVSLTTHRIHINTYIRTHTHTHQRQTAALLTKPDDSGGCQNLLYRQTGPTHIFT